MSDRLYLSCRVRGFTDASALRFFETALELFPFSKLAVRGPVLRVYAIQHAEPPAVEREFPPNTSSRELVAVAREFFQPDCCLEIDTAWDLWQFSGGWSLGPAGVTLVCFGSGFDGGDGEHLRLDLGLDARFLPDARIEGALRRNESNLRSLLHLVSELERELPLESRRLWSESGANFAGTLARSVARFRAN
jgi:hypothetical protein